MHDEYEQEGFLLDGDELEEDEGTLDDAEPEEGLEDEDEEAVGADIPGFEDEEE